MVIRNKCGTWKCRPICGKQFSKIIIQLYLTITGHRVFNIKCEWYIYISFAGSLINRILPRNNVIFCSYIVGDIKISKEMTIADDWLLRWNKNIMTNPWKFDFFSNIMHTLYSAWERQQGMTRRYRNLYSAVSVKPE